MIHDSWIFPFFSNILNRYHTMEAPQIRSFLISILLAMAAMPSTAAAPLAVDVQLKSFLPSSTALQQGPVIAIKELKDLLSQALPKIKSILQKEEELKDVAYNEDHFDEEGRALWEDIKYGKTKGEDLTHSQRSSLGHYTFQKIMRGTPEYEYRLLPFSHLENGAFTELQSSIKKLQYEIQNPSKGWKQLSPLARRRDAKYWKDYIKKLELNAMYDFRAQHKLPKADYEPLVFSLKTAHAGTEKALQHPGSGSFLQRSYISP